MYDKPKGKVPESGHREVSNLYQNLLSAYAAAMTVNSLHKGPVFYLTRKLYAYVINIKD